MMYGREARLPLDVIEGKEEDLIDDYQLYKTRLTVMLKEANEAVKQAIRNAAASQKEQWDEKVHKTLILDKGEQVLMYLPTPRLHKTAPKHATKFASHWNGPLTVEEKVHDNVYKVKDNITKRTFTVNVSNLQPFTKSPFLVSGGEDGPNPSSLVSEQDDDLPEPVEPDPLEVTAKLTPVQLPTPRNKRRPDSQLEKQRQKKRDTEQYKEQYLHGLDSYREMEIDEVLDHRRQGNGRYKYLIKWKHTTAPSWVASQDIYTQDWLKDYWSKTSSPTNQIPKMFRKYKKLPIRLHLKLGKQ